MKAKKLLTFALALCMILCNMPMTGAMENEGPAASISFADTANRTVLNDDQQIWEQNGITVTNDRAEATEPVKAYANPVRFYAGSTLTISYPNMGALEFDCSSDLFAVSLKNSLNIPDAQVYGDKVVALLPIIMDSYTIELYAQVRLDAVTVYTRGLPGASSAQRTDTALALGLNHIYVSDAETSNGVARTFTANAAGTYLLTSTHDTAYIRCGTELIQGNGSTTEFYLEEGESQQITVGPYLNHEDMVSFIIALKESGTQPAKPEAQEKPLAMGSNLFNGENIAYRYTAAENGVLTLRLKGPSFASASDSLHAEYRINGGRAVELKKNTDTALELCAGNVVEITVETNCSGRVTASWKTLALDVVAEGSCGENLKWTLHENGLLTIFGQGEMMDSFNGSPFDSVIKSVVIEEGATSIGERAFLGCNALSSVTIPASITTIGNRAFSDCNSLVYLALPENVTSIGEGAFRNCTSLASITIPASVTSIGELAFICCRNLKAIEVDAHNSHYCSDDHGVLFNKEKTTLLVAPPALSGSYIVPESVVSIGDHAFFGCGVLTEITIPVGVTGIEEQAFTLCSSLTGVSIPAGVTSIARATFSECVSLTGVTIHAAVASIGDSAFSNCTSLWHVLYTGAEARWNAISIGNSNSDLTDATRHYLCAGDEIADYRNKKCRICSGEIPPTTECPHNLEYMCEVVAPSCVEDGYTRYSCILCGDGYTTDVVPATGAHVMQEATETTREYSAKNWSYSAPVIPGADIVVTLSATLSRGYVMIQEYDVALDSYNALAYLYDGDTVEFTFMAGSQYRIYSFGEGLLTYTYIDDPQTIIPGDCYNETVSTWTCAVCGQNITENLGLNHNLVLNITISPTESTYGYVIYGCADCDAYGITQMRPLESGTSSEPCAEHNWADTGAPEATCESGGYEIYACLDCGEYSITYAEPLLHTSRPADANVVHPSYGWNGYYSWNCEFCGMYMEETISWTNLESYTCFENAATVHDLEGAQKYTFRTGNCTIVGSDTYLCNCCGQFIVVEDPSTGFHVVPEDLLDRFDPNNQVTIPVVEPVVYSGFLSAEEAYDGHCYTFVMPCYGTVSITNNFECYVSGIYENMSYSAGQTLTVNIWSNSSVDYEVIITVIPTVVRQEFCGKAATCTEAGYTDQYHCERCGEFFASEVIEAYGHDWNVRADRELSISPTCEEAGCKVYTCKHGCGEYQTEVIAALGHSYEAVVTKPTSETGGYTTYTCSLCGNSYVGDYTDPITYVTGDLNGNGLMDTDDAIYLLYYTLFGEGGYPVNQPCDYNGNGVIDTDDAIYLLYHTLFGAESYPLN